VEIETDKVSFEIPAPVGGLVTEVVLEEGSAASVGDVVGRMDESAEAPAPKQEAPGAEKEASSAEGDGAETAAPAAEPASEPRDEPAPATGPAPRVMPAAERLLARHGLSPRDVRATGPGGRLLKEDVLRHVREGDPMPAETSPEPVVPPPPKFAEDADEGEREETVPMSPLRRRVAERLLKAQQTAALLTTFNEVDMSEVIALRKEHRDRFEEKHGARLGFMSFFVKAAIEALKAFPALNAEIRGDEIVYKNYYDVGVAVGGGKGLVVPVIRGADRLSFSEIEKTIRDFAERAQSNRLELSELTGGTFTISNGGVYGSPIVNPPQTGILGLHKIEERPVGRDGQVVLAPMMYLAVTYDHRLVDGREAVSFLIRIKECIESPSRMLLEI